MSVKGTSISSLFNAPQPAQIPLAPTQTIPNVNLSLFADQSSPSSFASPVKTASKTNDVMRDIDPPRTIGKKRGFALLCGSSDNTGNSAKLAALSRPLFQKKEKTKKEVPEYRAPVELTDDDTSLVAPDPSAFSSSSSSSSSSLVPLKSAFDAGAIAYSSSQRPPSPPRKPKTHLHEYNERLLNIHTHCQVTSSGKTFNLRDTHKKGHFKSGFEVVEDASLFFTCFKKEYVNGVARQTLQRNFKTAREQYLYLKSINFPVNTVHNIETAEQDGGFLSDKVEVYQPTWNAETKFKNLNDEDKKRLKEIYQLVLQCFANPSNIPIDLANNIGVNKDGKLVGFDIMETSEGGKESYAFRLIARDQLTQLSRGCPRIYQILLGACLKSGMPNAETIFLNLGGNPERLKSKPSSSPSSASA